MCNTTCMSEIFPLFYEHGVKPGPAEKAIRYHVAFQEKLDVWANITRSYWNTFMIYHKQHYLWQFGHTSQAGERIIANLLLPVQFQSAFDTYPAHKN